MATVSSCRVLNLIRPLIFTHPAWVYAGSIVNEATTHLSVAILVSQCGLPFVYGWRVRTWKAPTDTVSAKWVHLDN